MTMQTRLNKRHPKRRITWRFVLSVAVLVLAGFLLTAGSALYEFLGNLNNDPAFAGEALPKPQPGENINILILGIDVPVDGKGNVIKGVAARSDTIMLATVDMEEKEVSLLSIPRDTKVRIPGRSGHDKMNAAHAYGGPMLALQTAEELFDIPVHYYIRTNVAGFSEIIDILGGVNIYVEKDMYYPDPWQDLVIDLKKGQQTLDGDKAMQYVRYRSDGDDLTRIHRQQKFMTALADKMLKPATLLRIPNLMNEITKYITTNMEPADMLRLANLAVGMNKENIQMEVMPGYPNNYAAGEDGGISYWIPDKTKVTRLMDKVYRDIDAEANSAIKIEILNGTNRSGLAANLSEYLVSKGFTVINTGNADNNKYELTKVIDRTGDNGKIEALAKVFGQGRLFHEEAAESGADITIIIGSDYEGN
ncbi:MAG: LCP family protein [bacterium]|jgi:LCP family protein required for cell wall assembly